MSNIINNNTVSPLLKSKELKFKTFGIAFISALLMFLPFLIIQGGLFTYFGDFTYQTLTFNTLCNRLFKEGQIGWCWWNNAGSDFVETFSYYTLGSPFFYLTLLFPYSFVPYLIAPIICLKIALSALFAYLYIRQYAKTPYGAMTGAILYAFSGWTIYNLFFYVFLDALILFPLLLYAIDKFINDGYRGVVCPIVALCILDNFYFAFQMGVFSCIYLLIRYFKSKKITKKIFLNLFFEVILGVLMGAVLLLPTIINTLQMPRISGSKFKIKDIFIQGFEYNYEILVGFFFPSVTPGIDTLFKDSGLKWSSVSFALPLMFLSGVFSYIRENKKSWLSIIFYMSAIGMFIPFVSLIFNAGNAYYLRWTFMPILFMALCSCIALEDKKYSFRAATMVNIVLIIFLAVIAFILPIDKNKNTIGLFDTSTDVGKSSYYLWSVIAIVSIVSILIFALIIEKRRKNVKKFFKILISCICISFIFSGMVSIFTGSAANANYSTLPVDGYVNADVDIDDTSENYRVSSEIGFLNLEEFKRVQSAENFQTYISNSTTDFYMYLGYNIGEKYSYWNNNEVKTFLSTKYYLTNKYGYSEISKDEKEKAKYKTLPIDKDGNLKLHGYKLIKKDSNFNYYENENYIPYGFTYKNYYLESETKKLSMQQKSALLLKGIMLSSEQEAKYGKILKKLNVSDAISSIDDNTYDNDCSLLQNGPTAQNFKITKEGFTCDYSSKKKNLLFFSVPYDEGWSAYINGKRVDIEKVNVGFMAIKTQKGDNKIEFKYHNTKLTYGAIISAFALLIYLIYLKFIFCIESRKREINQ